MEKTNYYPMDKFPRRILGEDFSETVIVFDDSLTDHDLAYYDYDLEAWMLMGDMQMVLICWCAIPIPDRKDLEGFEPQLTSL